MSDITYLPDAVRARQRLARQKSRIEKARRQEIAEDFRLHCEVFIDEYDKRDRREMDERCRRFALTPMTRQEFEILAAYRAAPDDKRRILNAVIDEMKIGRREI